MKLFKIAIHGVPRSGTTWLGAIFDSSEHVIYKNQPLFSYAFKSFLNASSSKDDINVFFEKIALSNDEFITQKNEKEKGLIPIFEKDDITHVVYKEARYHHILKNMLESDDEVKVVGIVRNPKSIIYSWVNAPKEFKKEEWDILKEWEKATKKNKGAIEEFYGFEKWKEVALNFLKLQKKYPNRFYLLDYGVLLRDTEEEVNKMFSFCNLDLGFQTLDFIRKGQKKDLSTHAYSVFRLNQKDDKWKGNLPNEIIKKIENDLAGTDLEKFLDE
ncbi:sulfotransferase domain-containing protein [Flavisericum labens]|uniref:sulfotransferase domain-containing protein n=1 Tax=Flavisericum labens TaxID=3377112 RepID=UPI00387B4F3B